MCEVLGTVAVVFYDWRIFIEVGVIMTAAAAAITQYFDNMQHVTNALYSGSARPVVCQLFLCV
ncbi:MAG: hypothetical protein LRY40_01105 [Shewanella fodinae]|nr:hypothetical protein [Shewanella fodinae]